MGALCAGVRRAPFDVEDKHKQVVEVLLSKEKDATKAKPLLGALHSFYSKNSSVEKDKVMDKSDLSEFVADLLAMTKVVIVAAATKETKDATVTKMDKTSDNQSNIHGALWKEVSPNNEKLSAETFKNSTWAWLEKNADPAKWAEIKAPA